MTQKNTDPAGGKTAASTSKQEHERENERENEDTLNAVLSRSMEQMEKRDRIVPRGDGRSGRIDGIVIGRLAGVDSRGGYLVDYPENPGADPVPALSTVALGSEHGDREVALAFQEGKPDRPIILGLIHVPQPRADVQETEIEAEANTSSTGPVDLQVDHQQLKLTAKNEIVLRCGKASITLTRSGKILIRGAYLLSRSAGVNRIKGGSVQIN